MTTKWTPGPWEVSPIAKDCIYATSSDCGRFTVAVMRNVHRQEQEANKRLIAAAPELVERLKECCYALAKAGHHDGISKPLTEARALLQRIEGE